MGRKDKRFVIQKHAAGIRHRRIHWDFMLEWDQTLQTYRLDKPPEQILHTSANAVKIFNHSLKFLTYQGPVNKGRGSIRIVETGTYRIIHQEHNRIELNLNGQTLKGKFTLTPIEDNNWQFSRNSLCR